MSSCVEKADDNSANDDAIATSASMVDSGIEGVGNDSEKPNINFDVAEDAEHQKKCIENTNNNEKDPKNESLRQCDAGKNLHADANRCGLNVKIATLHENSQEKHNEKLQPTIPAEVSSNKGLAIHFKDPQTSPVKPTGSSAPNYILSVPKIMITGPPSTENIDNDGRCSQNVGKEADISKIDGKVEDRNQRLENVKRILSNQILIKRFNTNILPTGFNKNINQESTLAPTPIQNNQLNQKQQTQFLRTTNLLFPPSTNINFKKRSISPTTSNASCAPLYASPTKLSTIKVRKFHTMAARTDERNSVPPTNITSFSSSSEIPKAPVRVPVIRPILEPNTHKLSAGAIIRPLRGVTPFVIGPNLVPDTAPVTPLNYTKMLQENNQMLVSKLPANSKIYPENRDSNTASESSGSPDKLVIPKGIEELATVAKKQEQTEENSRETVADSDANKTRNTQNYAFILENKLLKQDEKIDLTQLRLANAKITDKHSKITMPPSLPSDEIKKGKVAEGNTQPPVAKVKKKRLIVSNAKLKLTSKDDIAAMAKKVIQDAALKNSIKTTGALKKNSAVSAVAAEAQSTNMPKENLHTNQFLKQTSIVVGKDFVETPLEKATDDRNVAENIVETPIEPECKPSESRNKSDNKHGCSTPSTTSTESSSIEPTKSAETPNAPQIPPTLNLCNIATEMDHKSDSFKHSSPSTESVKSNASLNTNPPLLSSNISKHSFPKASLCIKKSVPNKTHSNEEEWKYREKILSLSDSKTSTLAIKEYPTIEIEDVLGDEEDDDEIDAVDFITSLASFSQNSAQSCSPIKSEQADQIKTENSIADTTLAQYKPEKTDSSVENTIQKHSTNIVPMSKSIYNTDQENHSEVHESETTSENNFLSATNAEIVAEKQNTIESKQLPNDHTNEEENILPISTTRVSYLDSNKDEGTKMSKSASSLTDTPKTSEQNSAPSDISQKETEIKLSIDENEKKATKQESEVTTKAPVPRKRIGIRNAPINLISRKKPTPAIRDNFAKAKSSNSGNDVKLSIDNQMPISSKEANMQLMHQLNETSQKETSSSDLNANVKQYVPNTHTPTVIKMDSSDTRESIKPLTALSFTDELLDVGTMQNDLDILATLSVAQEPLCVEPKSRPGVPALGAIIDMKAYGLKKNHANTEIIIKNEEITSKPVSVVMFSETNETTDGDNLNISTKSNIEKSSSKGKSFDENLNDPIVAATLQTSEFMKETLSFENTSDKKTNTCNLNELQNAVEDVSTLSISDKKCQSSSTSRNNKRKASFIQYNSESEQDEEENFSQTISTLENIGNTLEGTSNAAITSKITEITSQSCYLQNAVLNSPAKRLKRNMKTSPKKLKNLKPKKISDQNLPDSSKYLRPYGNDGINDETDAFKAESKVIATVTCSSDEIIPCSISDNSDSQLIVSFLNRRRLYRKRRGVPKMYSTSESEVEEYQPGTLLKRTIGKVESISETSSDEINLNALAASSKLSSQSAEKHEIQFASPFVPLKKRWEFSQQHKKRTFDETDITDDTSPIGDDDDEDANVKINTQIQLGNTTENPIRRTASTAKMSTIQRHLFLNPTGAVDKKRQRTLTGTCNSIEPKRPKDEGQIKQNCKQKDNITADTEEDPAKKQHVCKPENTNAAVDSLSKGNEIEEILSKQPKKRGRPRKSIVSTPLIESASDHLSRSGITEDTEFLCTSTPKRTRNVIKSQPIPKSEGIKNEEISTTADTEISDAINSTPKIDIKTRKRKQTNVGDFNPRLLLICRREQLNSDEPLTVPECAAGSGSLQCGFCLARTTLSNWNKHLAEHYGVGWIEGESSPVDLTTRCTVVSKIQSFLKTSGISSLSCRLCQRSYRSSLGIILHLESCGEAPQRVDCSFCGNNYTKLSLLVHQRSCTGRKEPETIEPEIKQSPNNDGRLKRVSLIKAEWKLKTLTQDLSQTDTMFVPLKFVKQLDDGSQTPNSSFICTICGDTKRFPSKMNAIKHVSDIHNPKTASGQPAPTIDFDSDGSEFKCGDTLDGNESENYTSGLTSSGLEGEHFSTGNTTSKKKRNRPCSSNKSFTTTYNKIYSSRCSNVPAFTQELWNAFLNKNHVTTGVLFEKFLPNIDTINVSKDVLEKLLPNEKSSMSFTTPQKLKLFAKFGESKSGNLEWQSLQRFQVANDIATDTLVYLGAPIKFFRWIPLPPGLSEQYLILAYRKNSTASSYVRVFNNRPKQTMLLVYKIKMVDNCIQSELHYAWYVPDGPVHTITFLPSGGYDESRNRLGLIAIGGVQSNIRVYSMPIDPTTANMTVLSVQHSLSNIRVIRLSIAFELVLNLKTDNDDVETQVLDICWSEFSGHEHIFASFSNGYIASWKIHEPRIGALNTYYHERENGDRCYTPRNYFSFEEGRVCGLAIHYDSFGPRWILAYSSSRNLCVFDIRDKTNPKIIKEESLKHVPRCIDWPPIWETFIVGTCDIMPNYGRVLSVYSPVGVNFMHLTLANSLGGISQVHYNPWQSVTMFATDNGDLCCVETAELNVDSKKTKRVIALSTVDVKRVDNNTPPLTGNGIEKTSNVSFPIVDKASKEQEKSFGLVFSTFSRLQENETSMLRNDKRKPPPNMERHTRINAVRWNLNATAKDLLAVGYENGFLRLCTFKRETYFN